MEPLKQIISNIIHKVCGDHLDIFSLIIITTSQTKTSQSWAKFTKALTISNIGIKHTKDNIISMSCSRSRLEASKDMVEEPMANVHKKLVSQVTTWGFSMFSHCARFCFHLFP
jgi:hypothetical protein